MCFNRYHFTQLMRCQRYSDEVNYRCQCCNAKEKDLLQGN